MTILCDTCKHYHQTVGCYFDHYYDTQNCPDYEEDDELERE